MVLSVDSGGAEPVSHDVVELSHSLSQAIPSLCLCVWISGSQLARSSYLEEGAKKEGRRETKFIWIEKWVAISRLHPFKQSVLVGMFQSSHYSWSVAKNFVPLFPFVFLFFLLSCYVRTSFYAAPAKYKLLGCRTVVGLGGCVRRAMAEEGRGGWEYLGSALGFASVWCVIVSACVCCVSKWDPNRKTSRTRMFRPSWGRCLVIVARFRVATFAIVSFHYGSLPSKRRQQQGWCATQILPTQSVRRRPQRVGRFDSATVAATTTRMARPARSRQVRTSRCLPPKGELIQQRHCIARCKNRDDTIVSPSISSISFMGSSGLVVHTILEGCWLLDYNTVDDKTKGRIFFFSLLTKYLSYLITTEDGMRDYSLSRPASS